MGSSSSGLGGGQAFRGPMASTQGGAGSSGDPMDQFMSEVNQASGSGGSSDNGSSAAKGAGKGWLKPTIRPTSLGNNGGGRPQMGPGGARPQMGPNAGQANGIRPAGFLGRSQPYPSQF